MRIAMVGSGYVGLVSGACLAEMGHDVTCIDRDADRIGQLRQGRIPIFEPGLEALVARNVVSKRLRFTTEHEAAVAEADVVFVAVGTPSRRGDGYADLTHLEDAVRAIATALDGFTVVAVKSTVPVGTGDTVERLISEAQPGADFAVVSNPEFLREGAAIEDFLRPDRVVLGVEDERAKSVMSAVYRPIERGHSPLLFMSRRTAELTKYAANAFLAMKVTFINEIADLCEVARADVQDLAHAIGLDPRIGARFLNPGPGYGGSCLPKDTLALVRTAADHERPLRLVETTIAVNNARKAAMARRIVAACGGTVRGKTIGLLGLTFKPGTDDMREAPSLAIIAGLQAEGATIQAFDPEGMVAAERLTTDVVFADDPYAAVKGADAAVIVTEWNVFRTLDFERLRAAMRTPVLVDLRNLYQGDEARRHGFAYNSIGRSDERPVRK